MCGILGIIGDGSNTVSQLDDQQLIAMRDTMTARGPDDAGLFREGPISLGHRRLAIRDLQGGQQPFVTRDGRFVLVFNGEIYNDDEIRKELAAAGSPLHSCSDTETLGEAWSQWGPACLEKLSGMFAFGIVDRRTRETWLVRDRCGVKPLFYSQIGREFVFASSIAAIRRHPRFSSSPNFSALGHYLQTLRTNLDHQTVFENVFTVRPAEIIHLIGTRRLHRTYWSLPDSTHTGLGSNEPSYDEAIAETTRAIEASVKLRLKSDVPLGMMMSGGVDSNTIATFARQQIQKPILGCCGGGVEDGFKEQGGDFEFAGDCAQELGFDLAKVRVPDDSYFETCESLIQQYDTPIATPTDAIIHQVARRLKQSVGVALGGEGADEIFCGYSIPHWSGNDFDQAQSLSRLTDQTHVTSIEDSLKRQYGRTHFDSPADHYLTTNGLIPSSSQQALFSPTYWPQVDAGRATHNYYQQLFHSHSRRPMTERYAKVLFRVNLESLLGRLDSATMAASLEARVPFTDHRLVEQAFKYPHHFKIDVCPNESKPWLSSLELAQRGSLRSKRILRSVASRLMPKHLAVRPKMSFPTPLPTWLDRKWNAWISDKLINSPFAKELFQPSSLREFTRLPSSLAMWKWPILNTVLWGDQCFQ